MKILVIISLFVVISVLALQAWRVSDQWRAARVWNNLAYTASGDAEVFRISMIDGLPEPARRYFRFAIRPGATLRSVAEIVMSGELGLGSHENPNYAPMHARQILAPPHGLVWNLNAGQGAAQITGSDGAHETQSWTRFWLLYTIPIVRVGGDADHARSAFGRVVAEGVFWTPAALLPQNGVSWESVDRDTARVTMNFAGMTQSVDVTVGDDGRPITVVMQRWSNANADKTYRLQPFGGYLSEFREFDGYTLPTRVEGGNFIGTDEYFPFYKAMVEGVNFVE